MWSPVHWPLPRSQFYMHDVHVKKLILSLVSVCVLNVNIVHNVIHFMYMNFLLSPFQSNVEGEEEKRET